MQKNTEFSGFFPPCNIHAFSSTRCSAITSRCPGSMQVMCNFTEVINAKGCHLLVISIGTLITAAQINCSPGHLQSPSNTAQIHCKSHASPDFAPLHSAPQVLPASTAGSQHASCPIYKQLNELLSIHAHAYVNGSQIWLRWYEHAAED